MLEEILENAEDSENEDSREKENRIAITRDQPMDSRATENGHISIGSGHTAPLVNVRVSSIAIDNIIRAVAEGIAYLTQKYKEYDLDENGVVTLNEVSRVLFDLNNDGQVTGDEVREKIFGRNGAGEMTSDKSGPTYPNRDSEINRNVDLDTAVKVLHEIVADKKLNIVEAGVLQNIPLSPEVHSIFLNRIDQAIESGTFNDVKCQMSEDPIVAAEKMVLAEYGRDVSETGLTIRALVDGSFQGSSFGVLPPYEVTSVQVGNILERFEIPIDRMSELTVNELEVLRQEGRVSILIIDRDELVPLITDYDDDFDAGRGANYVVVFVGVDRSAPDNEMVVVNDSGVERKIPMAQFMDAWEDSGRSAVVTRHAAPSHESERSPSTMTEQERNERFRNR